MDSPFLNFRKSELFLGVLQQGYRALDNPENFSFENIVRSVVGIVGISNRRTAFLVKLVECVIDDCRDLGCSDSLILDFKMLRHQYQISNSKSTRCKMFAHFLTKVAQKEIQHCLPKDLAEMIFTHKDLVRDSFYGGNWKFFFMGLTHGGSFDPSDEAAHYESCIEVSRMLSDIDLPISFLVGQEQNNINSLFTNKRSTFVGICFRMFTEIMLNEEFKSEYVKCLRLFYEYTIEPKVSCEEIKLFYRVFGGEVNEACLNRFGEKCVEYMPECALPCSPRSLKHLARCKLKKYLKEAGRQLNDIVPRLIPRKLLPYLTLDLYNLLGQKEAEEQQ